MLAGTIVEHDVGIIWIKALSNQALKSLSPTLSLSLSLSLSPLSFSFLPRISRVVPVISLPSMEGGQRHSQACPARQRYILNS